MFVVSVGLSRVISSVSSEHVGQFYIFVPAGSRRVDFTQAKPV